MGKILLKVTAKLKLEYWSSGTPAAPSRQRMNEVSIFTFKFEKKYKKTHNQLGSKYIQNM